MFEVLFYLLFRLTLEMRDVRPDVWPDIRPDVRAARVSSELKKSAGSPGGGSPPAKPVKGGFWGGEAPPAKIFSKIFSKTLKPFFNKTIEFQGYHAVHGIMANVSMTSAANDDSVDP